MLTAEGIALWWVPDSYNCLLGRMGCAQDTIGEELVH